MIKIIWKALNSEQTLLGIRVSSISIAVWIDVALGEPSKYAFIVWAGNLNSKVWIFIL